MAIIQKSEKTTLGQTESLHDLVTKIYDKDEIQHFKMDEAIKNHPLARRPTNIRSKLAYKEILRNLKPTTKYLLPGQISIFGYAQPKFKEELEYYDATPMIISLGLIRTKDNVIREIGLNLHYYPPFARERILNHTYNVFKPWFDKQFNDPIHKPSHFITWDRLKHIMNKNMRLAFGIKMYIPVLRGATYQVPTRLLPIGYFTEGHFAKATIPQIYKFWRRFK